MAGPIIRLKELMIHTGLSRSAIYDRMDEKSSRYAENFPKSFSLSGGAVGWFKNDVDAWLEACAANAKGGAPSKTAKPSRTPLKPAAHAASVPVTKAEVPRRVQKSSRQSPPRLTTVDSQLPAKQAPQPRNLGDILVEGNRINARLLRCIRLKSWTPAMGALIISGIEPPLDCTDIPDGGVGLDEIELHGNDMRFRKARDILDAWKFDKGDQHFAIEMPDFLIWCVEREITSEWFRLIMELTGCRDDDEFDLTASRFALLTGR